MPRLSFYPVGGDSYVLVVVAALVLLGLLLIGPARSRASGRRLATLITLRVAVIALVLVAMLRPTLVYVDTVVQSATLVVLADKSRSMSVPDEANDRTRWEAIGRALDAAAGELGVLDEEFEVVVYSFDDSLKEVELIDGRVELGESPDGSQTAIGAVLEDVLRQQAGKRLLGVVLLSDGAQRAYPPRDALPQTAAAQLKHLAPLFTFRFGKSRGVGQAQDVAVSELLADQRVFVKNQLTVSGQLRVDGYVNRKIQVQLLVETSPGEMESIDSKDLEITSDGQLVPVEFAYVPQTAGEIKVSIEAIDLPGELITNNNSLSTFVNVLKGGLNVLYLEGALRVEQRFLRRALDASTDINVDYVRLDPWQADDRPDDMAERFEPGRYDVYILGDLDSSLFLGGEMEALAKRVNQGAGLIMLGGFQSFGPGGYAGTALADVLPIRMDANERQPLGERIRTDLHLSGPLKMVPTPIGLSHFAMTLAAGRRENSEIWARLPLEEGANRFDHLKPSARTLATTSAGRPLLLDHTYGNGRVMAFAGDSTWRWQMRGEEEAHKRFWRQVVLWLARKDESQEGSVWVRLPQRRFTPGQRVEFSVGAQSPSGEPIEDATFDVTVVTPDGTEIPLRPVSSAGHTTGSFRDCQADGDYEIRVNARQQDKDLGSSKARFLVIRQDLELDNAVADATMLENLAAMTGGQSLAPEELSALISRLTQQTESLEVKTETKKTLWDTWALFVLFVTLLGTEWFLRKRWGMA